MPTLMALAGDVGFAGLALGLEGIEGLVQSFLRRTYGYRRRSGSAVEDCWLSLRRLRIPSLFQWPKNNGPPTNECR